MARTGVPASPALAGEPRGGGPPGLLVRAGLVPAWPLRAARELTEVGEGAAGGAESAGLDEYVAEGGGFVHLVP